MNPSHPLDDTDHEILGSALRACLQQQLAAEPALHLDVAAISAAGRRRRLRRGQLVGAAAAVLVLVPAMAVAAWVRAGHNGGTVQVADPAGASAPANGTDTLVDAAGRAFRVTFQPLGPVGRDMSATVDGTDDSWYILATRTPPLVSCNDYTLSQAEDGGTPARVRCVTRTLNNGHRALVWSGRDRVEVRTDDGLWLTVDRLQPNGLVSRDDALLQGALRLAGSACPPETGQGAVTWCGAATD